jgi:hypothetical protein
MKAAQESARRKKAAEEAAEEAENEKVLLQVERKARAKREEEEKAGQEEAEEKARQEAKEKARQEEAEENAKQEQEAEEKARQEQEAEQEKAKQEPEEGGVEGNKIEHGGGEHSRHSRIGSSSRTGTAQEEGQQEGVGEIPEGLGATQQTAGGRQKQIAGGGQKQTAGGVLPWQNRKKEKDIKKRSSLVGRNESMKSTLASIMGVKPVVKPVVKAVVKAHTESPTTGAGTGEGAGEGAGAGAGVSQRVKQEGRKAQEAVVAQEVAQEVAQDASVAEKESPPPLPREEQPPPPPSPPLQEEQQMSPPPPPPPPSPPPPPPPDESPDKSSLQATEQNTQPPPPRNRLGRNRSNRPLPPKGPTKYARWNSILPLPPQRLADGRGEGGSLRGKTRRLSLQEIRREAVAQQERFREVYDDRGDGDEDCRKALAEGGYAGGHDRARQAMRSHALDAGDTTVTQHEVAEWMLAQGKTSELELCLALTEAKGRLLTQDEKLLISCCVVAAKIFELKEQAGMQGASSKPVMIKALQKFRGRPLGAEEMEVLKQIYDAESDGPPTILT